MIPWDRIRRVHILLHSRDPSNRPLLLKSRYIYLLLQIYFSSYLLVYFFYYDCNLASNAIFFSKYKNTHSTLIALSANDVLLALALPRDNVTGWRSRTDGITLATCKQNEIIQLQMVVVVVVVVGKRPSSILSSCNVCNDRRSYCIEMQCGVYWVLTANRQLCLSWLMDSHHCEGLFITRCSLRTLLRA